ncbi:MAG TPA: glycosyltransferase family 39 protein [Pyrinomonadaceae bacterium]
MITTDVAFACFMLLSVYLFYRFVKSPSALRLFMVGAAVGLALAAKHTGVLILPTLFVLALARSSSLG